MKCDHCQRETEPLKSYITTTQVQRIDSLCQDCISEFEADRMGFVLGRPKVNHALPRPVA
jgi:hypothetical protein